VTAGNGAGHTSKLKTVGFGHAEDREVHHFVAAIPRSAQGEVMVYEVFSEDRSARHWTHPTCASASTWAAG
jgi:hypothetical protein